MGNFHHGTNRNKGREDRRGGQMTMHKAVCSECGNACEVPFRPSSDKPVFCNDCFAAKRVTNDRGSKERYVSNPRREFNEPRENREERQPREQRQEFARPAQVATVNSEETKKQFSEILNRLDKLTQVLEMSLAKKAEPAPVVVKEVKKVVEVKKPVVAKKVEAKKPAAKKVPAKKVVAKKKK